MYFLFFSKYSSVSARDVFTVQVHSSLGVELNSKVYMYNFTDGLYSFVSMASYKERAKDRDYYNVVLGHC